jgi:methyltransferase family protein
MLHTYSDGANRPHLSGIVGAFHFPLGRGLRMLGDLATRAAGAILRGIKVPKLSDDEWFALQFESDRSLRSYGIALPRLPSDDVQVGFTGLCGRPNLQQAFSFYRHVLSYCPLSAKSRILDFGGGWGRISRLFLREMPAEHIYLADTMEWSIRCLHNIGARFRIIHNQPRPPIEGITVPLDVIVSYSVFSHLSPEYFHAWTDYLLDLLHPGGYLVFTTRGQFFIDHVKRLHADGGENHAMLVEHIRRLREEMPHPDEIERRHREGEFQFYPIGGSGELTSDFFGEAFIPRSYIERHFCAYFIGSSDEVPNVDQTVFVLRKPVGERI